jgi:fibronectin-binding autotransporter adhesin
MVSPSRFLRLWLVCLVLCSGGLLTFPSHAASLHAWDGSSSGYWSVGANWFGGAPANGDFVVFNSGPSRMITTNDLNVILERIIFNAPGYVIRGPGDALIITNSLLVAHGAGTTTLDIYTRLWQGLTITNVNPGALLLFNGIVDLDRDPIIFRGNGDFNIPGPIRASVSGNGVALIKEGLGTLTISASNDLYQRPIQVNQGIMRLTHPYALGSNATVTVAESGTLNLGLFGTFPKRIFLAGTLTNSSDVTLTSLLLGGSNAVIQNISGRTLTVPVTVNGIGTAGFDKEGPGTLRLTGTNTYTGTTVVREGRLIVDGSQPASPVFLYGGWLYGTGTVGTVSCVGTGSVRILPGGDFVPGPSSATYGSLTLSPATIFHCDLVTTNPDGFRHLRVNGTVNLADAQLYVGVYNYFRVGDSFIILENDGADPISGQFHGLPEGSTMIVSNFAPTLLQITYAGGDGNDIALRVLPLGSIWDGSGGDGNWTNANNWASNFRPLIGDTLFFPAGAARTSNFCNYATGTPFTSIHFGGSGYHLAGNAITLEQGISAATNTDLNRISIPLALTANQTFTASNNALLRLGSVDTQARDLTLDGDGDFELLVGVLGNGALIKRGPGSAALFGTNTYTGPIEVRAGELRAAANGALGAGTAGTTVFPDAILSVDGGLTIAEPLTLAGILKRNNSGAPASTWNGPISLQGVAIVLLDTLPMTINGVVSGSGSLTKSGSGALTLTANNTYSGATVVNAGELSINGAQSQNIVQLTAGTLGGTGVVGQVFASGVATKRVEPGHSIGILTTSNILFNSFTAFAVDLNGTVPGVSHDQLNVRGTISLGNSRLDPIPGPSLAAGQVLRVINNDGTDAITGRFANLPEGGSITATNGMQLRITYVGGDGNDVELTVQNPPSRISTVSRTVEGYTAITGQGLANILYTLEASATLLPGSWDVVAVDLADPSGIYEFTDVDAPSYPHRFYRVSSP